MGVIVRRRVLRGAVAIGAVGLAVAPLSSPASGGQRPPGAHRACDAHVKLSTWTDARLAAQTVVVPSDASHVGALATLVHTGYGGILLFGTAAPPSLGTVLRRLEATTPQRLGMFVMTDEEGGGVLRIENLVAPFPWARSMAETMTSARITALATRVGSQLLAAGVNMDLAPVLDVDGRNVQPGPKDPDGYRSFGGSVSVVRTDGNAFADGLEAAGVVPVVKHFPGLGGSTGNTDNGSAATLPWPVLKAGGLRTFESAIAKGIGAIMVANARVPGLTPLPASISRKAITGVLRNELHFKGLVLTDTLTSGAITAVPLSVQAAAIDAIGAGADTVLIGLQRTPAQDTALAVSVANAVAAAVAHGQLARSTLVAAVRTILATRGIEACTS